MNIKNDEPRIIKGGIAVDDRGSLRFVNEYNFDEVKRFYMIENHQRGYVRAWHGHKFESKAFLVVKGSMLICGVKPDNWEQPRKDLKVYRFVMSDLTPSILLMPPGYANGSMSLTDGARVMVFSNRTLEEATNDDIRYEGRYWDPWAIEER